MPLMYTILLCFPNMHPAFMDLLGVDGIAAAVANAQVACTYTQTGYMLLLCGCVFWQGNDFRKFLGENFA